MGSVLSIPPRAALAIWVVLLAIAAWCWRGGLLHSEGMTLDEFEQSIIRQALKRANGNKSQVARLLGLTRNALRYTLTQMGLEA